MRDINYYSYIWEKDKEKYVLLDDEIGKSILYLNGNKVMFYLIEDNELVEQIIERMIVAGNKKYTSIDELRISEKM